MYSTMPRAFFGASLMSVISALRGSFGSSSPNARPASVSYWPAAPKDAPSNAGDTFFSTTIFFTDAWAGGVQIRKADTTTGRTAIAVRFTSVSFLTSYTSSLHVLPDDRRQIFLGLGRHN